MLLLGFGHKSRNGKDTAAEAIKNYFDKQTESRRKHVASYKGPKVQILRFANGLYQETNDWLGSDAGKLWLTNQGSRVSTPIDFPDWVKPDSKPEISKLAPYGKHPKLLQFWGTEYRRQHFGQDYWVNKTFNSIPANLDIALIADMRFLNEADAVKQRGGHTVNVQRLNRDGSQYFSSDRSVDHPSEIGLDGYNYDYYIKVKEGDVALVEQQAIALAVYLRALQS